MHRRKFLSASGCALISPVAGCINPEGTTVQIGEEISTSVADFSVQSFTVQQSVAYSGTVHSRIQNNRDTQYIIIGINVEEELGDVKEDLHTRFTLSLDGGVSEELNRRRISTENQSTLSEDMYLIYDVPRDPSLTGERLVFSALSTEYTWSISSLANSTGFTDYINSPPDPVINSVDIPSSVSSNDDEVTVGVTVLDDGNGNISMEEPLKLLIGSTKISGNKLFTAPVISGNTVTHSFKVPIYPDVGPDTETIRVNWGWDSISKDIEYRETS